MAKKLKQYTEVQLIKMFKLQRLVGNTAHPLMQEWLTTTEIALTAGEQEIFSAILEDAVQSIDTWHEEDLKMQFISFVLRLGHLQNHPRYHPYFERVVSAAVEKQFLKVQTDFMIASGILDVPEQPYFHFQEYKREKDPNGEPAAQVLEAMLIAQTLNQNAKPVYGCYIIGRLWYFVVLNEKNYCISYSYDCTKQTDLLQIIAVLRKFKQILETKLLDG